jgi:spectinomycin phosphotransferase
MLEKPELEDEKIIACLREEYGLISDQVTFLPLGADQNTAVYRVVGLDGKAYFVKLRRNNFDEMSVTIPKLLNEQGIKQIIPALESRSGNLWVGLDAYRLILYPFIEGQDGYQVKFSERQWHDFGKGLKCIHTTALPKALRARLNQETYSPKWRDITLEFLEQAYNGVFNDPLAMRTEAFLNVRRDVVLELVRRAERLARLLQAKSPELVLCHSDVHAGNILIDGAGEVYIVDWDNPILAPKERDLMFIGNAQGFIGNNPEEEERLFYRGYGQAQIDSEALAYYRYERIIEDIAAFCEQIFLSSEGYEDREQGFRFLRSNFLPGNTIDLAFRTDKSAGVG